MCVYKQYPELFHYTTVDAFQSIYKSNIFWATSFKDLNDSSELQCFRLKVRDFLTPLIQNIFEEKRKHDQHFAHEIALNGGSEKVAIQQANMHSETLHRQTFSENGFQDVFVCCFCTHERDSYAETHGLLSQWRGYGVDGGIAIVLDTSGIENLMHQETNLYKHPISHMGDVIYDNDSNLENNDGIRLVFDCFPEILADSYSDKQPNYGQIFDRFVLGSTLVKHHAFHEEREIRIVVAPRPTNPTSHFYSDEHNAKPIKQIKFRRKGEGEARYIELLGDVQIPIKRVIVGPSRIQNLNYQRINECVAETNIKIQMSGIPFVR